MEYSIQELIENVTTASINRMIPILIGQSKSIYKETLNFIDVNKTQLQLSNINDSLIDETTISVNIKSWNLKTSQFSITNTIVGINQIEINIPVIGRLPNTSIFVVVDINNNILFSSTINNFIYKQTNLNQINIDIPLTLTGTLICYIVNVETTTITGSFNSLSNILTVDTSFIFKTPSFNSIYNTSYVSYIGSSKIYSVNTYTNISQDIIDAEQNIGIKSGLILGQDAVVISYPNNTYITSLLEDLDKLNTGYYIVPINLDIEQTLASYINNKFYQLLISPSNFNPLVKVVSGETYRLP